VQRSILKLNSTQPRQSRASQVGRVGGTPRHSVQLLACFTKKPTEHQCNPEALAIGREEVTQLLEKAVREMKRRFGHDGELRIGFKAG